MAINIVLVEPEIPQNTGNIARTCACTGARLHLVRPFAFEISDKTLKRAGLDYWDYLDVTYYNNFSEFLEITKDKPRYFLTTKAENVYSDVNYPDDSFLIFGKETKGLPEETLLNNQKTCVRIPMIENLRSLNLSNAVAIVVYEVLRQENFKGLQNTGKLTKFEWYT